LDLGHSITQQQFWSIPGKARHPVGAQAWLNALFTGNLFFEEQQRGKKRGKL